MQGNHPGKPRLWSVVFVGIIALTFCCFVMGQGLNAGTSVFLHRVGYGSALAGVFAMVFSVTAAAVRLAAGPFIDGGKTSMVIICGIAVLTLGAFLPVLSSNIVALTAARMLQGAGFAIATTAASTAAADVLPASRLGEGIGYHGLGQALAMSVGPAFALFLVGTDPASNLYLGLGFVGLLGLGLACLTRYERHPEKLPQTSAFRLRTESTLKQVAADPDAATADKTQVATAGRTQTVDAPAAAKPAGWGQVAQSKVDQPKVSSGILWSFFEPRALAGAIPMITESAAFGFGIFFCGLYGTHLGIGNPGLFYTISAIAMIGVRLKSGAFMDKVAPLKVFGVALVFGLVGFAMLYFSGENDWLFYLAGIPYGICLGISLPLNQSVAVKNTPSERWGAANALFLLCNDVGIGTASAIWGYLNQTMGFDVTILCVMGCLVVSFCLACITYPKEKQA